MYFWGQEKKRSVATSSTAGRTTGVGLAVSKADIQRIVDLLIEEQERASIYSSELSLPTTSRILWTGIDLQASDLVKACLAKRATPPRFSSPELTEDDDDW